MHAWPRPARSSIKGPLVANRPKLHPQRGERAGPCAGCNTLCEPRHRQRRWRESPAAEEIKPGWLGAPQFRQGETAGFGEADGGRRRPQGTPLAWRRGKGRRSQWARGARARAFGRRRDLTGERRDGWSPPWAWSSPAAPVPSRCASSVLGWRCVSREEHSTDPQHS